MIQKLAKSLHNYGRQRGLLVSWTVFYRAFFLMAAGSILAILATIYAMSENQKSLTEIQREEGMEESYQIPLEMTSQNGEKEEIMLTIPRKEYTDHVIKEWFQKGKASLESRILGENESLSHVTSDLNLITGIPDTKVAVSWASSKPDVIDFEGRIGSEASKDGNDVTLYVTFSCQNQIEEFEIPVTVFPSENGEKQLEAEVQEQFEMINADGDGDNLMLPNEVLGEAVWWSYPREPIGLIIWGMTMILTLVLIIGKHQETQKKEEKQKEQMLADYPNILNKFSLLLSAGMNTRKAFAKVALDYRKDGKEPRAAYEAIAAIYVEMEQGVPEAEAYEHLGKRCNLPVYKSFATLLIQNLRKGNRELMEIMEREVMEAFENRKRRAKILGEKAGTKLLFPMMGMLIIVFVILLVPAWSSFM